jgi:CRP-like cAMP-binding protein
VKARQQVSSRPRPSTKTRPPPPTKRPSPTLNLNLLLASLPTDDYARLIPTLDVVPLKLRDILHKPGQPIQHVYFPGGGFCSIVTVLEDGRMVEVATVGREGMLGIFAMSDGALSAATMVQGEADICYRMKVEAFRDELDRRGTFYDLMTRYAQALVGVVMQSTACNAVHTIEQRLARWLLLAHDRMSRDDFPLTQEFVSMMLGTTRPAVTVVAGALQKAGLVTYRRGHVTILNRRKLEAASCECYRASTDLLKTVTGRDGQY